MVDILIADDDPLVRRYLSIVMERDGHRCIAVENGAEAIALLACTRFDMAIVDIFMPVKEGIETILEIRQRFPDTKIAAMSAGGRVMTSCQALDFARCFGADAVLPKPFSLDALRATMSSLLDRGDRTAA